MKLALLLPGYLDSPDYLHLKTIDKRLTQLGYTIERIDLGNLWTTGDTANYTVTNFIKQIKNRINFYRNQNPEEIILIGHSLGGFTSIVAGNIIPEITQVVALCPPSSIEGLAAKWIGKSSRISRRDLPENANTYREFSIPFSFVEDTRKYSAIDAVGKITMPLMILIAMSDTSVPPNETEILVSNAIDPHVVRLEGMEHNFRLSENESSLVADEIKKFIKKE